MFIFRKTFKINCFVQYVQNCQDDMVNVLLLYVSGLVR